MELEDSCGLPGAQTWVLQEVVRNPEIGITELAGRLGIHQSTCSIIVEKLTSKGYLIKQKMSQDQRRIGLRLTPAGEQLIAALPGPAEGVLPEALAAIPLVCLKTLHINLEELILHIPGKKGNLCHNTTFRDGSGSMNHVQEPRISVVGIVAADIS